MNSGDTAWVLTSSALVLLMTIPGLAFFYGGLVRRKNVLSVLMQCLIILCVITLQWVLFGYSLTFGPDTGKGSSAGSTGLGLRNVGGQPNADYAATIPHYAFMIFQCMFAVITPALIIGTLCRADQVFRVSAFTVLWATFRLRSPGSLGLGDGRMARDLAPWTSPAVSSFTRVPASLLLFLPFSSGNESESRDSTSPLTTCPSRSWAERCSGSGGSGSMRAAHCRPMSLPPPLS